MTPSSLFLSHFLIFISFLVHNLLPGHLQLEELCLYQHPSQQQRHICISANLKCLSKLTQGYGPRGQLKCHGHDPRRAILSPWLEGELRFSVPSALSQGIKACSSWLVQLPLPAILCMSSSASCLDWEQVPFKRWLLKKSPYKHTVNQLQTAFKYTFKTLHILASNTSWVLHSHVLKCSKCQIMSFSFQVAEWKKSCHLLFPINTNTSLVLTHGFSHRNARPCMSCRWISKTHISLSAFSPLINNIFHRPICNTLSKKTWHGCHVYPQPCSCPRLFFSSNQLQRHLSCMHNFSAKTLIWTLFLKSFPPLQHIDFILWYGKCS